jgi:hypothetical protein
VIDSAPESTSDFFTDVLGKHADHAVAAAPWRLGNTAARHFPKS